MRYWVKNEKLWFVWAIEKSDDELTLEAEVISSAIMEMAIEKFIRTHEQKCGHSYTVDAVLLSDLKEGFRIQSLGRKDKVEKTND